MKVQPRSSVTVAHLPDQSAGMNHSAGGCPEDAVVHTHEVYCGASLDAYEGFPCNGMHHQVEVGRLHGQVSGTSLVAGHWGQANALIPLSSGPRGRCVHNIIPPSRTQPLPLSRRLPRTSR